MGYIEGITISTCINIVCVCGLVILGLSGNRWFRTGAGVTHASHACP
ncbi:hypothetical protein [Enterocloster citroniae]